MLFYVNPQHILHLKVNGGKFSCLVFVVVWPSYSTCTCIANHIDSCVTFVTIYLHWVVFDVGPMDRTRWTVKNLNRYMLTLPNIWTNCPRNYFQTGLIFVPNPTFSQTMKFLMNSSSHQLQALVFPLPYHLYGSELVLK